MYFKSVNRGISFTKSGTYVLCFVVLLGILAAASGYNALFLALAFGSGLLITSGLLSEQSIKPLEITGAVKTFAEAQTSFRLRLVLKNRNSRAPLFGSEVIVTEKVPRFRLFHPEMPMLGFSRFLRLIAGEELAAHIPCRGMERGIYTRLPLITRTLYPFGLISKFKVGSTPNAVVIFPAIDALLRDQLLRELKTAFLSGLNHPEFHSHRPYTSNESARHIDWKKSAGKKVEDWAVKVFVTPTENNSFVILPEWGSLSISGATEYRERFLSRVLTACEVVGLQTPSLLLALPDATFLRGGDDIREFLAGYPTPLFVSSNAPAVRPMPTALSLKLGGNAHSWEPFRD
jgi:uncharacterized protein (DUF58 family)